MKKAEVHKVENSKDCIRTHYMVDHMFTVPSFGCKLKKVSENRVVSAIGTFWHPNLDLKKNWSLEKEKWSYQRVN